MRQTSLRVKKNEGNNWAIDKMADQPKLEV
jgi:hypothetical protein